MRKPDEKELACLRLVCDQPNGVISQDDERLAVYCDDRLTHNDTFNRCCDEGWLKPWHDNRFDSSTAELTPAGRVALFGA